MFRKANFWPVVLENNWRIANDFGEGLSEEEKAHQQEFGETLELLREHTGDGASTQIDELAS